MLSRTTLPPHSEIGRREKVINLGFMYWALRDLAWEVVLTYGNFMLPYVCGVLLEF